MIIAFIIALAGLGHALVLPFAIMKGAYFVVAINVFCIGLALDTVYKEAKKHESPQQLPNNN